MSIRISTHGLRLRPETLPKIEQHLRKIFLSEGSQLTGVTLQLAAREPLDEEERKAAVSIDADQPDAGGAALAALAACGWQRED